MSAASQMLEIPEVRARVSPLPVAEYHRLSEYSAGEKYWILLPVEHRIEVHRRPEDGAYLERSVVEGDATLECESLPGIHIRLLDLLG